MKIDLACAVCGSNNFELNEADTDDSEVACGECGHAIGTLGELKLRLAEEVAQRSTKLRKGRRSPAG